MYHKSKGLFYLHQVHIGTGSQNLTRDKTSHFFPNIVVTTDEIYSLSNNTKKHLVREHSGINNIGAVHHFNSIKKSYIMSPPPS